MHETRTVKTGHIVRRPFHWENEPDYPRLLVGVSSCTPQAFAKANRKVAASNPSAPITCACEGFEVCLHFHAPYVKSPVWPVMSARSWDEAREYAAKLRAFARNFEPTEFDKYDSALDGNNVLLLDWIKSQGFVRRNRVIWAKPL